jgi:putative hemolysin
MKGRDFFMRHYSEDLKTEHGRFTVQLALTAGEIESALRLRYEVFNRELDEGLPGSYLTRMDKDPYDDYCDHLIVIDTCTTIVVGTYRLMPGIVAENSLGYYSESEFELSAIKQLPGEKLELGRSCVHRDYRNTAVVGLLWKGIAAYVERFNIRHLFGCASLHTTDPEEVNMIFTYLDLFHRADERFNVRPLIRPQDVETFQMYDRDLVFSMLPPLMKGYLRIGAQICGEPAYDPVFGTTDFFMLLDPGKLLDRYRKRFFGKAREQVCAM